MLKFLSLLIVFCTAHVGIAQATLFTEDFETGGGAWIAADDLTPNSWIVNTCSGNGTTSPGTTAAYITPGGIGAGCAVGGDTEYAYTNSGAGASMATYYTNVDGTCASAIMVNFDYRIESVSADDYAELVYSTDGGTSWTPVGSLGVSAAWTNTTIALPALLDGTSFELGFRFTYNDNTILGNPIAVDNIVVSGTDTVNPLMTCPGTIIQGVDLNCDAFADDYTKAILALSDNCTDSADILVTQDIPEFTPFLSGPGSTEIITITATDEAGNSIQCVVNVDIIDDISPTPICPADTVVYVDANCEGIIEDYIGDAIITDNCTSLANMVNSQSPVAGTVISGAGVITPITITVTDESGNTETCNFNATTVDSMVATIVCPANDTLYANAACQASLPDYTGLAVANDNCVSSGSLTISQSPAAAFTVTADVVVTLTVSGGVPNIDQSCNFTTVFIDTISPQIVCPTPTDLYVNASCETLMSDYTGSVTISDNCTAVPMISQTPLPGSTISSTNNVTVTLTATDASGNSSSCQFTQTVLDTISPSIICPGTQSENADANCQGVLGNYSSLAVASDNCSSVFTIIQSPLPGATMTGTTAVTLSLTDDSGNANNCVFNVNLIDGLDPTVTCPSPAAVSVDANCEYVLQDFTGSAVGADNCTAAIDLVYTQTPAAGVTFGEGTQSITINVFDNAGNSGSCAFNLDIVDLTAPSAVCPSSQTVYADGSCEGSLLDYTALATVTDNCTSAGNFTLSQSPIAGTIISTDTPITITAVDAGGNSNSCVFNALLIDTISPTITCPANQDMTINSSCAYTVPDLAGGVGGSDNCSALGNMSITQNPLAGNTENGITIVTLTMIDEQGNSATCTTTLSPIDLDPPTITCPSIAPVNNGSLCDYTLPNYGTQASVLDNCQNFSITQTPPAGTVVQVGSTDITLLVTDAGGNTDQCTFTLDVFETYIPVISCPQDISTCDPLVTYLDPQYNDNCLVSLSQTDATGLTSGMLFPVGITTLEYTAVDSSGNMQTCNFNIEILDYPSPANIVDDTLWLCSQNGSLITADPISTGSGEWTVIAGQGNFNNQFANSTGVNNIGIGINAYQWTVSSPFCGSLSDTLIVFNGQEDLPASTQDTLYACSDVVINLEANTPLYGIGTWTSNGEAIIGDINSASTTAAIDGSGWQAFIWSIESEGCPTTTDTLHVLSNHQPTIITMDTSICIEVGSLPIEGPAASLGQSVQWTVLAGSTVISPADSSVAVASDLGFGINTIVYTVSLPGCPSRSDTLRIITTLCEDYEPVIPTVITPNSDGLNDLFVINYMEKLYPECHVVIFNRWGSVIFESTGYADAWDGTYKNEPLPMGTYFYRIELNDELGTVFKGDISIIR